jgi:tRNA1Val (adenine37-N6)-methyltransferase
VSYMLTLDTILDLQLYQSRFGYRFSADAVLLSSFVSTPKLQRIADLGAGSGIIGLLLARKYPSARITMIELQESLVRNALKNVEMNGLGDRVEIIHVDIRNIFGNRDIVTKIAAEWDRQKELLHSFDLIVSNPPFRKTKTGFVSPSDERATARHEIHLPIADLTKSAFSMLKHHGRLCIIHLPERLAEVMAAMRQNNLEPKRIRFVHTNTESEAKMALIEAVKEGKPGLLVERPLYLYNQDGQYTEETLAIYGK